MAIVIDENGEEHGLLNRDMATLAAKGLIAHEGAPSGSWRILPGHNWAEIEPSLWEAERTQ